MDFLAQVLTPYPPIENREYVVFITQHVVTESKPSEVDKDALKKILEKK